MTDEINAWAYHWRKVKHGAGVDGIAPIEDFIVKHFSKLPNNAVLCDIGAGSGILVQILEEKLGKRFGKVYLCDLAPAVPETLRYIPITTFAEKISEKLKEPVDVVLCSTTLSYGDKEKIIGEVMKILNPGGLAVFICHVKESASYWRVKKWIKAIGRLEPVTAFALNYVNALMKPHVEADAKKLQGVIKKHDEKFCKMLKDSKKYSEYVDVLKEDVEKAKIDLEQAYAAREETKDVLEYIQAHTCICKNAKRAIENSFKNIGELKELLTKHGLNVEGEREFTIREVMKYVKNNEGEEYIFAVDKQVISTFKGPKDKPNFIGVAVRKPV